MGETVAELEAFLKTAKERRTEKPQRCEYCQAQATKSLLWAEGMAYIAVCDAHEQRGRDRIEKTNRDEVVGVHTIKQADYYGGGDESLPYVQQLNQGNPWGIGLPNRVIGSSELPDLYHLAPTSERDRIYTHGLQPSMPALQTDSFRAERPDARNIGVYGYPTPKRHWQEYMEDAHPALAPFDWWRIPAHQIQRALPDEKGNGAFYLTHPVYPELHEGPEHRIPEPPPFQWGSDTLPYKRQLVEGNPWGIGMPDRIIGSLKTGDYRPYVPIRYHDTLNAHTPQGTLEGHANRWPTVYDNDTGVLHIGPEGTTHHQVANAGDTTWIEGAHHGWLGHNPEGAGDNHMTPEGDEYGWYSQGWPGAPPRFVNNAMLDYYRQHLQPQYSPATPGGFGHGQNVLDMLNRNSRFIIADQYTNDSREWPDPSEPRASKPPGPIGCTCDDGWKLECPVHGMHPTESDNDYTWSQPQANPIGFPSDQPRNWQQAHSNFNWRVGRITLQRNAGVVRHSDSKPVHSMTNLKHVVTSFRLLATPIGEQISPLDQHIHQDTMPGSDVPQHFGSQQIHSIVSTLWPAERPTEPQISNAMNTVPVSQAASADHQARTTSAEKVRRHPHSRRQGWGYHMRSNTHPPDHITNREQVTFNPLHPPTIAAVRDPNATRTPPHSVEGPQHAFEYPKVRHQGHLPSAHTDESHNYRIAERAAKMILTAGRKFATVPLWRTITTMTLTACLL